jgi:DNA-binding transcriptional MerR regulator
MTAARKVDQAPESDSVDKSADAFRTIGEAAAELGLKTHVLRFWETKFSGLKPMKRADGRRYYRPEDMALLRTLQQLLHVQGLTIRGALKALKQDGAEVEIADEEIETVEHPLAPEAGPSVRELQTAVRDAVERGDFRAADVQENATAKRSLETLLADLTDLKSRLDTVRAAG